MTVGNQKSSALSKSTNEISPRLLTRQQAAAYCGVSVPTFTLHCPVPAVSFARGKRLERYDILSLDRWIDGLARPHTAGPLDWLASLEGSNDDSSRERS